MYKNIRIHLFYLNIHSTFKILCSILRPLLVQEPRQKMCLKTLFSLRRLKSLLLQAQLLLGQVWNQLRQV
jgi:hypothetical protein